MIKRYLFQEADFYGASQLIFDKGQLPVCYKATWMHGLGYVFKDNYNKNILIHYNELGLPVHLVNNSETTDLLASEGVDSIPVGAPYIYTKDFSCDKESRMVYKRLYMPTHSIGKNDQRDQYSRWRAIISKYNCDAVCLAGIDYNNVINDGVYLGDINIVRGASPVDCTSLNRMASMFSSTHEVITDMIGSHIIYAAASGASVRILSEISEYYNASGDSSKLLNSIPKKVRQDFQEYYKDNNKNLNKILSSIWMTGNDLEIKEYSEYVLGVEHRRSKDVIKSYLTPDSGIQKINIVYSLLLEKFSNRVWR